MDDQFMVAAYLSTDESLADLRCGVLDTGCNNTCYTGSGLRGLFNRSMGAPIQHKLSNPRVPKIMLEGASAVRASDQ